MKWKKTGAALLVTTLTVTSAGYAFANNQLFDTVDLSKLNQQPAETTVVTTVSEKPVTPSKTEVEEKPTNLQENGLHKIPADYPYDNLKGLYKAYENAQNPKAKESIKLKIEYLIAKYETVKKYKSDDLKEYAKDMEELKKESLKNQQEAKKEALKEQKEKEKKLRKAQQELRKELKEKEKELHKAEKYKNKHNQKNKHEDNDED